MQNTLENNSGIFKLKSKFFLYRIVSYFSFLLIPILAPKALVLHPALQGLFLSLYIAFILSQWFLLGKEIDHRLKIYFRVNSSIDRIVYRLFLGMFFFVILFNLISLLSSKWINNSFWIVWGLMGLFYSWPTRGKIIQESVSSNFGEFRFLDRFEKTLLFLVVTMFIFSMPDLPPLVNIDTLKLYFDPMEHVGNTLWNFLLVNFYPFKSYPTLFRLAWSLHFYMVFMGFFLLIFYAFLRFFVSRRLSLLGVFALISSWSFSKTLGMNSDYILLTTFSLLWVWTILWATKSSTYRSGLFLGLVSYYGSLINVSFSLLMVVQLALLYFVLLKDKTFWFRRQLLKYAMFGSVLTLIHFINHSDVLPSLHSIDLLFLKAAKAELVKKSFYVLGVLGILVLLVKQVENKLIVKPLKDFHIEAESLKIFLISFLTFIIFSLFWDEYLITGFSMMWILAFLSLIPIELIFQSLSRVRSRRNMIYLLYILICLLDSHFEGRVKIFLKIFF
jgi:hypothetical protein